MPNRGDLSESFALTVTMLKKQDLCKKKFQECSSAPAPRDGVIYNLDKNYDVMDGRHSVY